MSDRRAQFPEQVWDGTAADRNSRQIDASPAYPSYDQVVAELIATQQFAKGLVGGQQASFDKEVAENVSEGDVVYIDLTSRLQKARNDIQAGAQAVGLMSADALAFTSGNYITDGQLELLDWSGTAGTTDLVPGAIYYLDQTPGKITTTAPTADGYFVVKIGRAQTERSLDIEIGPVIRL